MSVVWFWRADEAARTLTAAGCSDAEMELDWPLRSCRFDEGAAGWVAAHGRALHIPDVSADDRLIARDWMRAHGLKSFYGVPVVHDGTLLAVLTLHSTSPLQWSAAEERLLEGFVAQAAVALRHAQLYQGEAAARREAELALAQVRQLQGMLPICAYCKKIRNDRDYWESIESYLGERSQATFSHGICPECRDTIVKPELEQWRREQSGTS